MKWIAKSPEFPQEKFIIEQDEKVGFYVYVYDEAGRNTHDYLQDTLKMAKDFSYKNFGVPIDAWTQIE